MKIKMNKKVTSLVLAVFLLFAMAVPALAAGGSGAGGATITINGQTGFDITQSSFSAYKIFDLTTSPNNATPPGDNYAYTVAPAFSGFTAPYLAGTTLYDYLTNLAQDTTTNNNSAAMNTLAADLWAYIGAHNIQPDGTAPPAATGASTVTISPLDYGYYLVYSTQMQTGSTPPTPAVVAACTLTTASPAVTITPKVDAPTLDKQVMNNGTPSNYTSANVGDTVNYQLTSTVPSMIGYSSYTYTVHDVMSSGLDFDSTSVKVYVGVDASNNPVLAPAADYTLVVAPDATITDGCTFEIRFDPTKFVNYTVGAPILVTYSAKINSTAVMAPSANDNQAHLEYSNNPYDTSDHGTTPPSEADVYTCQFDVFKYDGSTVATGGDPLTGTGLPDAKFELLPVDASGNTGAALQFVDLGNGSYRVATADEISGGASVTFTTTTLVTPALGLLNLQGVGAGTYQLKETLPPAGFNAVGPITLVVTLGTPNPPSNELPCTVTADGSLVPVGTNGNNTVPVANNSGAQFPITGGMGTTIFFVGGLLLMVVAAAALIARRKTRRSEQGELV